MLGHAAADATDQVERVGVQQRVLRGDHLAAAVARADQGAQELVPVLEVEHPRLRFLQHGELLLAPLRRELPGLEVLAAQHLVDALEPAALEAERDRHAQQLIRIGLDEVVERATAPAPGAGGCRDARQNCSSAARPSSQNTESSVRMKSAWLSFTPSLLMRTKMSATCSSSTGRGDLQRGERVLLQVEEPVEVVADLLLFLLGQR